MDYFRDSAGQIRKRKARTKWSGGISANQVVLDAWVEEYNSIRPNEAIDMQIPDEIYHVSERKYTGDYDELEYPIGFLVRKVLKSGEILINGIRVTIGYSLRGWHVGLQPLDEGRTFHVFLADFLLGTLDLDSCCFYPLTVLKSDKT